jgi:hypothetical protein
LTLQVKFHGKREKERRGQKMIKVSLLSAKAKVERNSNEVKSGMIPVLENLNF